MNRLIRTSYPEGFTSLIAEVADTAMRAMQQSDPFEYVQDHSTQQSLEVARLQRGLTPQDHADAEQRRAFRLEVLRTKIVRDLTLELIDSFFLYDRLRRYSRSVAADETEDRFSRADSGTVRGLPTGGPRPQQQVPKPVTIAARFVPER